MSTSFVSHALLLKDLFDKRFQYTIPLYQRPYAWSIQQSSKLLDDLISAMGDEAGQENFQTYFLGAIILTGSKEQISRQTHVGQLIEAFRAIISGERNLNESIRGDFAVVDGKQRLITLKILLCLLRDLAPIESRDSFAALVGDGEKENAYRLNLTGGESSFFYDYVLKAGATLLPINDDDLPMSQRNIMLSRNGLRETLQDLSSSERSRLFDYIINHCEIVVILTEQFFNAYQIFLSINDTGTNLSPGDILKAELMANISPTLVNQYRDVWAQWNDSLGEPETNKMGKKTFFSHLWYVLTPSPANMLKDIRKKVDEAGGAVPFIDNILIPYATAYRIIKTGVWPNSENKVEVERLLGTLNWLAQDEWMSSAMLAITRFGNDPDKILTFFQSLERLAYGLQILPMGAKGRRKRYNPVKHGLRDPAGSKKDPLKEVQLSATERKTILATLKHGLHRSHSQAARLVLARLDLQASGRPVSYYDEMLKEKEYSIEHLLPRNPRKDSNWLVNFADKTQREYKTESLGNLFLVHDKSENAVMKNFDFPVKHEVLFNQKPEHPVALTNELRGLSDWQESDIDKRQERMLALIEEIWQLS